MIGRKPPWRRRSATAGRPRLGRRRPGTGTGRAVPALTCPTCPPAPFDILDAMRTRVAAGRGVSRRRWPCPPAGPWGRRCGRSTTWGRPGWCRCSSGCRPRPACCTPARIPTTRTRLHRAHGARRPCARRLSVAEPRRRRPEHHRHRALRRARRHPHRGTAAGAAARRRRAVLHPRRSTTASRRRAPRRRRSGTSATCSATWCASSAPSGRW